MPPSNNDLMKVISEFNRKVSELMHEKESLLLQLSKQEILARSRSARVSELENSCAYLLDKLAAEQARSDKLQNELDDCILVLEETICVNKALKNENGSVELIQAQLARETQSAKRFEELYLDLLHSTRKTQKISSQSAPPCFDSSNTGANHRLSSTYVQTESLLTLSKYSQANQIYGAFDHLQTRDG